MADLLFLVPISVALSQGFLSRILLLIVRSLEPEKIPHLLLRLRIKLSVVLQKIHVAFRDPRRELLVEELRDVQDRKSTRLNSSHLGISYAVFCLQKKK